MSQFGSALPWVNESTRSQKADRYVVVYYRGRWWTNKPKRYKLTVNVAFLLCFSVRLCCDKHFTFQRTAFTDHRFCTFFTAQWLRLGDWVMSQTRSYIMQQLASFSFRSFDLDFFCFVSGFKVIVLPFSSSKSFWKSSWTFRLLFADVSTNGQFQDLAMHSPSLDETVRVFSSHLFPTKIIGTSSNDFLVDFICKSKDNFGKLVGALFYA